MKDNTSGIPSDDKQRAAFDKVIEDVEGEAVQYFRFVLKVSTPINR